MTKPLLQFEVTGYLNGAPMPSKFATSGGGGENVSPGLKWQALPAAQSYVVLMDDKAPVANHWVHWFIVDIPNTVTDISEGVSRTNQIPAGSRELETSWGQTGYDGPQPPVGSGNHEYVVTLYAMDIPKLNTTKGLTRLEFLKAFGSHVIAEESWSGYYQR